VVIDEPKTDIYGGMVAAPAFKQIAEGAMAYLGVAPSFRQPLAAMAGLSHPKAKKLPIPGPIQVKEDLASVVVTEVRKEGSVPVPPLTGWVGRDAVAKLLAVALEPRLNGSGRVVAQAPPAGTVVPRGTRVTLEMRERAKEIQ
jgi:cell division protein FtsI (penicillin-binding protein 3)